MRAQTMQPNQSNRSAPASATNALIVEGGAMRGIFSTGVLDGFLAARFDPFDLYFGVSSGAGNLAAYLADMPERNFKIYTDYSLRPEFIDPMRFLRGGHLMDLDWLWKKTIAEIRLDLKTIYAKRKPFLVCLTDVMSGRPIYKVTRAENLEAVLKASSALPILYRTFPPIDGRPSLDGGIADPIPIAETIQRGARRIMVLRSRPKAYRKREGLAHTLMLWQLRRFPSLRKTAAERVKRYNASLALIRKPPRGVSVVEICPPDDFQPTRLGRDEKILLEGYRQGLRMAEEGMRAWAACDH